MARLLQPSGSLARAMINLRPNQTQSIGNTLGGLCKQRPPWTHTYEAEMSEGAHLEAGFGHSDGWGFMGKPIL